MTNLLKLLFLAALAATILISASCADSNFASSEPQGSRSSADRQDQDDDDENNEDDDDDNPDAGDDQDDIENGEDDDDDNDGLGGGSGENTDIILESEGDVENGLEITEDEYKASLPGVEVQKVGVNFEDLPDGDFDFNDAVFCFTGVFKLNGSDAVSYKEQTVAVALTNRSGQNHDYEIYVEHEDGTKSAAQTGKTESPATISLDFKRGSKLFVKITTEDNNVYDIHNPTQTQVLPDQCNTDGD